MLLSKLDQRCEACICSHPDRAMRDVEGWGLETEKSYLWADIWKKQRPPLSLCAAHSPPLCLSMAEL